MNIDNGVSVNNKLITTLLVLMPIFNVYATPISGFGVGDLVCLPLLVYALFFKRTSKNTVVQSILTLLIVYFAYAVIISLFNLLLNDYSMRDVFIRLLVDLFYIVILFTFTTNRVINADHAYKIYVRAALVVSALLFIQVITHYVLGRNVFFLIPFLNYNQSTLSTYEAYVNVYEYMYSYQFRPTSVFLEPSHFALYVSSCVAFVLNKGNVGRKEFIFAFLMTVAVLFSTSGTGYLIVLIVWVSYIFKIIKSNRIKTWMLVFGLIACFAGVIFVLNNEYIPVLISRITSINDGSESSINVRLLKGFYFAQNLNPLEQLFGIGCGTYDSYINFHPSLGSEYSYEYMNSLSEVLVSVGWIGVIIFVSYLLKLRRYFKKGNMQLMLYIVLALYATGSVSFSWFDCLPLILTVAITDERITYQKRDLWERSLNS